MQLATEVDRAASFERELRKGAALASQMVEVEAENTKLTDLLSALEDELSALRNEAPSGTRPPASVPGGTAIGQDRTGFHGCRRPRHCATSAQGTAVSKANSRRISGAAALSSLKATKCRYARMRG